MSSYHTVWPCCGDTTITDAWGPSECPFCTVPRDTKLLTFLLEGFQKNMKVGVLDPPEFTVAELKDKIENEMKAEAAKSTG